MLIGGIAASIAVAMTIVGVVIALAGRAPDVATPAGTLGASPPSTASPAATVPTGQLASMTLPDAGGTTLFENAADPVKLTSYAHYDQATKNWIYYARDSLTGKFRKYPDHWEAFLSPDGRYVAKRGKQFTTTGYDSVEITDQVSGETFTVETSRKPLSAYIQTWSGDSTKLLVNVGNPTKTGWQSTGYAVVDLATRKATVASLREDSLRDIRYGFDRTGTRVVALSWRPVQQALRLFTLSGERVRRLPNVGSGLADNLFSPSGRLFATNCPGLENGTHCVYDLATGAEVRRFESGCSGATFWWDESHLVCWARPDQNADASRLQVVDFTGKRVRVLAEADSGADALQFFLTFT
ncbi:hypothetical protein OIE66_20565 [Nonomuraea sp. NBC_01738]|uniref:hypothetical protein n=1 Tax=Nonomuraea sp. NBC_01738 TaxID=2976003 RepID=UPI002E0F47F5|nr:hypothetical protein OIE66_20565 [Nonomuraea sp. NBC_01738]